MTMADPNIQNILAALAAQSQSGTPAQGAPPPLPGAQYPPPQYATPPGSVPPYGLPQPISSGSVDLGGVKPVGSGSVNIAGALAQARGYAADKGIAYDPRSSSRNEPRRDYRRSRSPTPSRGRDVYRDGTNPYRDERRGNNDRNFRERSFSPRGRYNSPGYRDRSPARNVGAGAGAGAGAGVSAAADGDSDIVPIEKSLVGLIIGRAGENLRRVEQQTGARVQFMDGPETTSSQRHCKISGSRAARTSARAEIFKIIEDNELAKRGQDKSRVQGNKPTTDVTQEGDSMQIMVPDRTVGLIIGRGGETIRDLQERSGCHVNIVGENKSVNGYRPVNLIGSAASQQHAKDLIFEIVESDQKGISIKDLHSRRQEDPYGKINDNIKVPGDAVGMIIGKGGETIRDMQNQSGCKINVSPPSGRDIERDIGLIGTRGAIEAAKRLIREKVDVATSRGRSQGADSHDDFRERYDSQQPSSYPPASLPQAQSQPLGTPAPAAGGADPYAAYGGYNNYLQMWYAAVAAQQQNGQGQGEQR